MADMDLDDADWFRSALAVPFERASVTVDGVSIDTLAWGPRDAPGLVFVHGMYAHAGWWRFIAPFFAGERRCVAFSLSGMGRSEWRDVYSVAGHCREIEAVTRACGITGDHAIVAHSFGGIIARRHAEADPAGLSGLILVDSPTTRTGLRGRPTSFPLHARYRPYPSVEDAVRHFRLAPPQVHVQPDILDLIARESLRQDADGWRWSTDPDLRAKLAKDGYHRRIVPMQARTAFLWGDQSPSLSEDDRAYTREAVPSAPAIVVRDAGHHIMLDQPLALVAHVRAILDDWDG